MTDHHWAVILYERYVQLYGEPIEAPITPAGHTCKHDIHSSPMNNSDGHAVSREGEQPPVAPKTLPPAS